MTTQGCNSPESLTQRRTVGVGHPHDPPAACSVRCLCRRALRSDSRPAAASSHLSATMRARSRLRVTTSVCDMLSAPASRHGNQPLQEPQQPLQESQQPETHLLRRRASTSGGRGLLMADASGGCPCPCCCCCCCGGGSGWRDGSTSPPPGCDCGRFCWACRGSWSGFSMRRANRCTPEGASMLAGATGAPAAAASSCCEGCLLEAAEPLRLGGRGPMPDSVPVIRRPRTARCC
jgi:hypothetical protein